MISVDSVKVWVFWKLSIEVFNVFCYIFDFRSDSWRHNHHCGIPLRLLDPKRRASSWLVTRKTSQDSNLSSSRNDSSGSGTTASTSTWRISRSSGSSEPSRIRTKPRLTRQCAIQDDFDSPGNFFSSTQEDIYRGIGQRTWKCEFS